MENCCCNPCYHRVARYDLREKIMGVGVMDILTLVILGAALVLLVKNPKGSASLISSSGNVLTSETNILTGNGYKGGN